MTVCYTAEVATCRGFGCFLKLLRRWRGSIYKLVWMDLIVFLAFYYTLSLIYRLALNDAQKENFENLVRYCNNYGSLIPLSFVLGFYVSVVMKRWWDQYMHIPWPDPIAVFVSSLLHGQDERSRVMRRTIMRYVCLCLTMVLGNLSPRVKRRFPSLDHLVEAGLLQESEKLVMQNFVQRFPKHSKHWMPIVWSASIVKRARKEGRIRDDFAVKTIIDELNKFRGNCGLLGHYDVISVPLVYTQVVTLAVYSYFLCSAVGKQWTERPISEGYSNLVDYYFPLFTTLEFFFYVGWLKVAETLINPFGEDDDDFEINWLIDRNLLVSYLIVDEMHHEHPELIKDQYWDEVFPNELPYASDVDAKREEPPEASTAKLGLSKSVLSTIKIDCARSLTQCASKTRDASVQNLAGIYRQDSQESSRVRSNLPNGNSFASLRGPRRVSSTLIAVVQPSQKQVNEKPSASSSGMQSDEENPTLVNIEVLTSQTPDVREIFRQPQTKTGAHSSTSAESLLSMAPGESDSMDDFERLKEERERKRLQRQRDNVAFTVGVAVSASVAPIPQASNSDREALASRRQESSEAIEKTQGTASASAKPEDKKEPKT